VVQCRGFLAVKSWWNAGEAWQENSRKAAAKNAPHFSDLFLPLWGMESFGQEYVEGRPRANRLLTTINDSPLSIYPPSNCSWLHPL
jgi:hypothetical protein